MIRKKRKFLASLEENEKAEVPVLVPKVYETVQYYCRNCSKFTERMCDCGNFPEPDFRITGLITDGTKTVPFKTASENVSERMTGMEKGWNPDDDEVRKSIMRSPYVLSGRMKKGRFIVEKAEVAGR